MHDFTYTSELFMELYVVMTIVTLPWHYDKRKADQKKYDAISFSFFFQIQKIPVSVLYSVSKGSVTKLTLYIRNSHEIIIYIWSDNHCYLGMTLCKKKSTIQFKNSSKSKNIYCVSTWDLSEICTVQSNCNWSGTFPWAMDIIKINA